MDSIIKKIIRNSKLVIPNFRDDVAGQSLIEILIALAIGALLIGGASVGVAFMLRSSSTNQNLQTGSLLMQDMVDKVRSFAGASWGNVYDLTKGTSTQYYLAPSSTQLFAVEGKEGELDNDVTGGLVGKWGFDEATGSIAYDDTGNNDNGTFYNSPTYTTSTCKVAGCRSFDGVSQYVSIPDPVAGTLDVTSAYSISFWMKSTSTAPYAFIVSKTNSGSGGGYEVFLSGGGKLRFSSCDVAGSCAGGYFDISTPLSYNDGDWHSVVATVATGSLAQLYVDGVSVKQSATVTQSNLANGYPLVIGGRGTSGGSPFAGLLDDVRIYDRELSSGEVQQLSNSRGFARYFSIDDVCRTNDASSTISGVTPCASGSIEDPSTEKIMSTVEWQTNGATASMQASDYVTRWKNDVFEQTDWSGGVGADGPYTEPSTIFSSSSNVDTGTQGTIRLHNL